MVSLEDSRPSDGGGGHFQSQDVAAVPRTRQRRAKKRYVSATEIRRGGDPLREKEQRREAPTIADLYNDYIERHAKIHLRPNTIRSAEGMAKKHILPKIGNIK